MFATVAFNEKLRLNTDRLLNVVKPYAILAGGHDNYSHSDVDNLIFKDEQLDEILKKWLLELRERNVSRKNILEPLTQCIYKQQSKETQNSGPTLKKQNSTVGEESITFLHKLHQFLSDLPKENRNNPLFSNIHHYLTELNNSYESSQAVIGSQKAVPETTDVTKKEQGSDKEEKKITDNLKHPPCQSDGKADEIQYQAYCDTNKYLIGRVEIKSDASVDQVKNEEVLKRVKKGGVWTPEGCRPVESVAIIIPYRDRRKHLEIFVNHMHSFLQRQQLRYGIFVVEQARPTTFNRGLLANVGFLAAQSTGLYNCYVIHDVDLLPLNDRNIYNCSGKFRHLSAANSKFGNSVPYNEYAGGVIALREDIYVNINGFSNVFFGWGGEDDDVWNRARARGYSMERPEKDVGAYIALQHAKDALNPANPERFKLLGSGKHRWDDDGVNSMNFQQLSLATTDLYTLVYVRVDQNEVMQTKEEVHINGIKIFQSDLKTLQDKKAVNDKIINAYFWTLHEGNQEKMFPLPSNFKYQQQPTFPVNVTSSKIEFLFAPIRSFGHWALIVISVQQQSLSYLDPVGNCSYKEIDFIKRTYQSQFNVKLSENGGPWKEIAYTENEADSGLFIMMYAKRIIDGKPLLFKREEIDAARRDIESSIIRR